MGACLNNCVCHKPSALHKDQELLFRDPLQGDQGTGSAWYVAAYALRMDVPPVQKVVQRDGSNAKLVVNCRLA